MSKIFSQERLQKVSKYTAIAGMMWVVGTMGSCMTQPTRVQTIGELQSCYTRMSGSKHSISEYFYCDFKYGNNQYQEIAYRPSAYMKMKGTDGTKYHIEVPNPDLDARSKFGLWGLLILGIGIIGMIATSKSSGSDFPRGRGYF
ncbi:hypothetical protein AHP1_1991 [Aeromonas phage Ahp1_CNU-2021]|nr:hypothetical protein AHP1_1991 [Aeromonas phage Ahp1_CNU-2021]